MRSAMLSTLPTAAVLLAAFVAAQTPAMTPAPTPATTSFVPTLTAVSECHPHSTVLWCMAGTEEYQVVGPTKTEEFQAQYTDCHTHGSETFCVDEAGEDVQVLTEAAEAAPEPKPSSGGKKDCHFHAGVEHCVGGDEGSSAAASSGGKKDCHFHAGVEHCVGGDEESNCDATQRDYNIGLRVGLLFVILVTSAIGVFTPVLTRKFNLVGDNNIIFVVLKQFGTGIVISTAFIHLFTHADLMFGNSCLGELKYEGTTAAIFMAGLFLSFLIDYLGARFVQWRQGKQVGGNADVSTVRSNDKSSNTSTSAPADPESNHSHAHGSARALTPMEAKINVMNLEAGIIFHSILIGITLVVSGDSFFITLFIVILFHQMFEGIALGTCIAELPPAAAGTLQKLLMAGLFALITPLGMAIGIGVLNQFNGNDPSTIVAIGTLDALSAGILAWVGIVEMLARDWMSGNLLHAGPLRTSLAMFALICGLVLMSVLGKWA
ncbi:zinc/iron transporter protein [Pyrenophora tritici-repentis]|nr:zinc/iron transporter protein [Pyrenophora tritici-repentis]KAI0607908.1 zinc/iron transporter protein [Pyrenophora tritici-repentis]KAI0617483.1 zinc/iron transporter protein [Pyrenophora tritici-repentis]